MRGHKIIYQHLHELLLCCSQYLMTAGGLTGTQVKLYSLEEGHSVPDCLQNLEQLPEPSSFGAGAALGPDGEIPLGRNSIDILGMSPNLSLISCLES